MRVRIIGPTQKTVRKRRTCAYARVSTDSESQSDSLENQMTYYEKIIRSNPDYEYVEVFADRGITGTIDNRPEFQRMLELAREGMIHLIITKSISRFARNTTILLQTVRELKDIGVEVIFEKENISTLSGDGELMLTVLSSFAQEESRSASENVKWSIRRDYQLGKTYINTNRFLGYEKDENGNLVINEKEAELVRPLNHALNHVNHVESESESCKIRIMLVIIGKRYTILIILTNNGIKYNRKHYFFTRC